MLAIAGAFTPLAAGTAALLGSEEQRGSLIASVLLGWAMAIAAGLPLISVMGHRSAGARPTGRSACSRRRAVSRCWSQCLRD